MPLVIGESNVFEFASHCESKSVGSDNTFEAKCKLFTRTNSHLIYCSDNITIFLNHKKLYRIHCIYSCDNF